MQQTKTLKELADYLGGRHEAIEGLFGEATVVPLEDL